MTKLTNWKECVEALLAGKTLRTIKDGSTFSLRDDGFIYDSNGIKSYLTFMNTSQWHIVEPTITITESEMRDMLAKISPGNYYQYRDDIIKGMGFKK